MMQTTLSPNLVAYTSMNNQTPENNLKPRIKVTLIRRGILDCRGKPLLQNLEQVTLNNIKSIIYGKSLQLLVTFTCKESRLQVI